jgi:hypothetical protein
VRRPAAARTRGQGARGACCLCSRQQQCQAPRSFEPSAPLAQDTWWPLLPCTCPSLLPAPPKPLAHTRACFPRCRELVLDDGRLGHLQQQHQQHQPHHQQQEAAGTAATAAGLASSAQQVGGCSDWRCGARLLPAACVAVDQQSGGCSHHQCRRGTPPPRACRPPPLAATGTGPAASSPTGRCSSSASRSLRPMAAELAPPR